jgi:N-carbamoyl-L-amino-acid hydrolase
MTKEIQNIRVNGERLWESIMAMAKIGPGEKGGSRRLALTDEDKQGRDLFVNWCEQAGCTITVDDMGNIFARRPGKNNNLDPICAGSHLDTQPHGGKFDGIYGVLSALEVIRTLNENDIQTEAPIEAINWTNEEGSRFAPAMIASGVFAGLFEKEFAYNRTDSDGKTLRQELERIGYLGDETCGDHPMRALFESHIEQGPILEKSGDQIGVVIGGQGQRWFDVTFKGQDSHAGSTPMVGRRDALVASAKLIQSDKRLAKTNRLIKKHQQFVYLKVRESSEAKAIAGIEKTKPIEYRRQLTRIRLKVIAENPDVHDRIEEIRRLQNGIERALDKNPSILAARGRLKQLRAQLRELRR